MSHHNALGVRVSVDFIFDAEVVVRSIWAIDHDSGGAAAELM